MERTETRLENLETHMANVGASLKTLESHVGKITRQLTSQSSEIGMVERERKRLIPHPSKKKSQLQAKASEKKGLEVFKNLYINIYSADMEEVTLTEGGDEEIQRNLPQKLQDLGEFIVPCAIKGQMVGKVICDSGASVNVMPSSLYEKFGLSRMKTTELILQLADKSFKIPLRFVDDVEVQIDKLRLPSYFVVLDIENSQNVLVILGRPCLATVGAIIDVKQRKLRMEVEGQMVVIKASKRSHDPP
ncbi:uncharacterized protein [Primulina huaijiensis]|uniref:uncharacterized protein n=1 Tax=Primulina huaijiensis TaxID=1492673 RepID=UPI003CC784D6